MDYDNYRMACPAQTGIFKETWVEHDLIGKPVSTFPDHALLAQHDRAGKPVSTFADHALKAFGSGGETKHRVGR
jgi:hypothetical protein